MLKKDLQKFLNVVQWKKNTVFLPFCQSAIFRNVVWRWIYTVIPQGSDTLARAVEHIGFADANHVSRIFRRYYGMALTEYRQNKLRQENQDIQEI